MTVESGNANKTGIDGGEREIFLQTLWNSKPVERSIEITRREMYWMAVSLQRREGARWG